MDEEVREFLEETRRFRAWLRDVRARESEGQPREGGAGAPAVPTRGRCPDPNAEVRRAEEQQRRARHLEVARGLSRPPDEGQAQRDDLEPEL